MDLLRAIFGSKLLQGIIIGVVASSIFFLILARYEIKEFKALGFHIVSQPSSTPQITSLTTKLHNANQALADKERKLQSLQKKNELYRSDILSVKQELDALTTKGSEKTAQIAKLKKQVTSLKRKISAADKASKQWAEKEQRLQTEINKLSSESFKTQTNIDDKTKQIEKLNEEIEQQKSQIGTLTEANAVLRSQIAGLEQSPSKPSVASSEQAAAQCGEPDPKNEGEYRLELNETLRLFSNTFRIRIKKIVSKQNINFVSFRSNIKIIEGRELRFGDVITFHYLGCSYDITIGEIFWLADRVDVRVNKN